MIGPLDTFTLARTKLRSKRILLTITIIVSGLLFGILAAAILLATGVSNSITNYFTTSLGGHYLVNVSPNVPTDVSFPSTLGLTDDIPAATLAHLKDLQNQYIEKQKSLYKKYGIEFDPSSVTPILKSSPFGEKDSQGNTRQVIDWHSPVFSLYTDELQQEYVKTAHTTRGDLKRLTATYGAMDFFIPKSTAMYPNGMYLADGKEDLTKLGDTSGGGSDYIAESVQMSGYQFADRTTASRFILPDNAKRQSDKTAIPVVLATSAITKTFGKALNIPKKPSDPHAQVNWMRDIQQKVNGYTYQVCWRSQGEIDRIQSTLRTNTEIADNKNNKNYLAPALQYNLSTIPCGDITVKQDTRSAAEKKLADTTEAMQKELGTYKPISHQLLTFQVVGVMSVSDMYSQPNDVPGFLSSLLGPQFMTGAFIPDWLYDTLPASAKHEDVLFSATGGSTYTASLNALEKADIGQTIVSFPSIESARAFINTSCQYAGSDCKKDFAATAYGANYLLADTLANTISAAARIALPVAIVIATIIIWVTMARVIIDSRRETAVFRALGAKRRDIASIYLVYSLIVALYISIFMLTLGLGAALVINQLYSGNATDIAQIAYGSFGPVVPFHLIGFNLVLLGALVLCVFAISLVAALPPLWRNVRRSPIRDMRDE